MRRTPGTTWWSRSSRFPESAVARLVSPVRFAPGRARLATSPYSIGFRPAAITMGMVLGRLLDGADGLVFDSNDDVDVELDHVRRDGGKAFLGVRESADHHEVPTLGIAEIGEPLAKRAALRRRIDGTR